MVIQQTEFSDRPYRMRFLITLISPSSLWVLLNYTVRIHRSKCFTLTFGKGFYKHTSYVTIVLYGSRGDYIQYVILGLLKNRRIIYLTFVYYMLFCKTISFSFIKFGLSVNFCEKVSFESSLNISDLSL